MKSFLQTTLGFIVFAIVLSYFSNPIGFELRMNDLQNEISKVNLPQFSSNLNQQDEQQSRISLCDNEQILINDINSKTDFSNSPNLINLYDYKPGFEHWSKESLSSTTYSCRKGEKEGENKKHSYCTNYGTGKGLKLKYERTDGEGNIERTASMELPKIVLDNSGKVVDLKCNFNP